MMSWIEAFIICRKMVGISENKLYMVGFVAQKSGRRWVEAVDKTRIAETTLVHAKRLCT